MQKLSLQTFQSSLLQRVDGKSPATKWRGAVFPSFACKIGFVDFSVRVFLREIYCLIPFKRLLSGGGNNLAQHLPRTNPNFFFFFLFLPVETAQMAPQQSFISLALAFLSAELCCCFCCVSASPHLMNNWPG